MGHLSDFCAKPQIECLLTLADGVEYICTVAEIEWF